MNRSPAYDGRSARHCYRQDVSGAGIALLDVANFVPNFIIGLMKPRGIYRERKGWGNQDSARVKYDEHQELDVPEDRYRARGYQPPFDQLPWKEESANDNA